MTEWIKYDGTNRPADGVECRVKYLLAPLNTFKPSEFWTWQSVTHFMLKDEPKQETAKMISMDKKYRTRDGREVRLLCVDGPEDYPVIGVIDGQNLPDWWRSGGEYTRAGDEYVSDLIEYHEPDIRTIWVNVYEDCVAHHETKDDAIEAACSDAIAIAQPVTFEVKRT